MSLQLRRSAQIKRVKKWHVLSASFFSPNRRRAEWSVKFASSFAWHLLKLRSSACLQPCKKEGGYLVDAVPIRLRSDSHLGCLCGGEAELQVLLFEPDPYPNNQNQKSFGFRKERKPRCVRETKSSPNPSRQVYFCIPMGMYNLL